MKLRMFAVITLLALALLPFAAEAQRGGGGSRGGSSSGSVARSTGGVSVRSANTVRAPRDNSQPRNETASRRSQPTNIQQRFNTNHSAFTSREVVRSESIGGFRNAEIAAGAFHQRGWWPGGLLWGIWYGPGWYYSWGFYPGVWYYGSLGYGYQFAIGEPANLSGIKFDLDQIPKKDLKEVENGNVLLNGRDATHGRVKNFSGISGEVLHLDPGDYEVTAKIKGGQITMKVAVQPGHVTHVALSFDQERKEGQLSTNASSVKPGSPTMTPAPAPTDSPTD
jgi:hypothetical protein